MNCFGKIFVNFVFTLIVFFAFGDLHATTNPFNMPIAIDERGYIDLSSSTSLLEDRNGKLDFKQILSASDNDFTFGSPSIGLTSSAYWFRWSVCNRHGELVSRFFDTGNRRLQEIDFYYLTTNGDINHYSASATRTFAQRIVKVNDFSFPVVFEGNQCVDLYLRVRSTTQVNVAIKPAIVDSAYLDEVYASEKNQWLIYCGMASALALFNLLLFFSLRDNVYIFYVASLISMVWSVSSARGGYGAAHELIWPNMPLFEQISGIASTIPTFVFVAVFLQELLNYRLYINWLYRVINLTLASIVIVFGTISVLILFQNPSLSGLMQKMLPIGSFFGVAYSLEMIVMLSMLSFKGHRSARFAALAWIPMAMAIAYVIFQSAIGAQSSGALLMWGSAFEMVLMSLVLADRYKQLNFEKNRAQEELLVTLKNAEIRLEEKVESRTIELNFEKARAKKLLHNILPVSVAEELEATGHSKPNRYEHSSILFTDFSGFTQAASSMPADRMVSELSDIFAEFDNICDECGVEKIKTIGDSYMAVAGVPLVCDDHAERCVRAGLKIKDYIDLRNKSATFKWSIRVGIHSGPVIAGVVGRRRYAFDVWGDTVNIASRMESSGFVGRVNISAYTFDLIRGKFNCTYRGKVDAKGKGAVDMYFVDGETV